jgi:hypothetical protein
MVRANIEEMNEQASFCPYDTRVSDGEGELIPSDGHYNVFDYLYLSVGLRGDDLENTLLEFEQAAGEYINSEDDDISSFTFKPEHGGATYYFRKFDGEPSEL